MTQITLDASFAKQIQESLGPVEFLGPNGVRLGVLKRTILSDADIQEMQRRAGDGEPRFTTEQVLAKLNSLS